MGKLVSSLVEACRRRKQTETSKLVKIHSLGMITGHIGAVRYVGTEYAPTSPLGEMEVDEGIAMKSGWHGA